MSARSTVLALLATLLLGTPGSGQVPQVPLPNVGPPLLLRLDGELLADARERPKGAYPVVSFGFLGEGHDVRRAMAVHEARTIGGDHPLLGRDVLERVAPFDPNLLVNGPPERVAALRDAAPGVPLRVVGLVSLGSRTYYLRSVEVRPAGR